MITATEKIIEDAMLEAALINGVDPKELTIKQFRDFLKTYKASGGILLACDNLSATEFNRCRDWLFKPSVTKQDVVNEELRQAAKKSNTLQKELVLNELFLKRFSEVAEKTLSNKVELKPYKSPPKFKGEREINLLLSDLHFGSMLKSQNGTSTYGPNEEARRLAAVMVQVAEYKRDHRKESTLNIHFIGDLLAGKIHNPNEGDLLAKQACATIHYGVSAIAFARTQYSQVNVKFVPGNHGRWPDHKERDVVNKHDSLETVIHYGIKMGVKHIPGVNVEIPQTPYYIHDSVGGKMFLTHGDTILRVGNPSASINVKSIEQQINAISASLNTHFGLFAVGHVHTASFTFLPCNTVFVTNGALIPPDQYAQSLGIFNSVCGQWIWESVKGYPWGDNRLAKVDSNTDKDAALEKIIPPFEGYNG